MCRLSSVRLPGLVLLCGLLTGCGLDNYEQHMAAAQARVERFDKENRVLDGPLQIPTRSIVVKDAEGKPLKDADGNPVKQDVPIIEVFLRPPRGISRTADNLQKPIDGFVYRYPRKEEKKDNGAPSAAPDPNQPPPPPPPEVTDLYLALDANVVKAKSKDAKATETNTLDDFIKDVVRVFTNTPLKELKPTERTVQPPGRSEMTFTVVEVQDREKKVGYSIYVYHTGTKAIAIVFQRKGEIESLLPAMNMSLESLGVDAEALPLSIAYNKRPGALASPPKPAPPR